MYSNYGLYNLHDENKLLLLFNEGEFNRVEKHDEVEVLFHDDQIVGYQIFNFIRYAKIKYTGIIFLPPNSLIDIINSILKNNGLEGLEYKKYSRYVVKDRMVYCEKGTFMRDFRISNGQFCSYYDLYIKSDNPNDLVKIDEEIVNGIDFFNMEEK